MSTVLDLLKHPQFRAGLRDIRCRVRDVTFLLRPSIDGDAIVVRLFPQVGDVIESLPRARARWHTEVTWRRWSPGFDDLDAPAELAVRVSDEDQTP